MHQHREVPHFLRDLVGEDRERGHHAKMRVGEEGGRDQHAVDEVVQAITDEREPTRGIAPVVLVALRRIDRLGMTVPPQQELLEHEENRDAREQRHTDGVDLEGACTLDRVRYERQQRGGEQGAGRETDRMRHHPVTGRFRQQQEKPRHQRAQGSGQGRGQQDHGQ